MKISENLEKSGPLLLALVLLRQLEHLENDSLDIFSRAPCVQRTLMDLYALV